MKYKCVIFDVDGTIIDPVEGVVKALDKLAQINNWEILNYKNLGIIGPPMKKTLMRLYDMDDASAAKYAADYREIYINETLFDSTVYPGIENLFRTLHNRGILIGIATYKRTDCAEMVMSHYGLRQYTAAISGDTAGSTRTKAEIICDCMEKLGVKAEDVLMIGDTLEDFNGAEGAGADFCGVTYGYGFCKGMKENDKIKKMVDDPLEILNLI